MNKANKADLIRPGDEALLGTLERANRLYKDGNIDFYLISSV